jgi:hypothetical protein
MSYILSYASFWYAMGTDSDHNHCNVPARKLRNLLTSTISVVEWQFLPLFGVNLVQIAIAPTEAPLHPHHSKQFCTRDLMVDKRVQQQFERGLSAKVAIVNLTDLESVPAPYPLMETENSLTNHLYKRIERLGGDTVISPSMPGNGES